MNFIIREILEEEYSLLENFLYEAIFVPEGISGPPKSIIRQPDLQVYLTDFGKKEDINKHHLLFKRKIML